MSENGAKEIEHPKRNVAFVEKGQIVIEGAPDGEPARIGPCAGEGYEITVDGKKSQGFVAVSSSSSIVVVTDHVEPKVSFQIVLEDAGVLAKLHLKVEDGFRYALKDSLPSPLLNLKAEKIVIPAELDVSQVVEAIKAKGIVYGFDQAQCIKACMEKPSEPVIIAKGKPATPGKDGQIEFLTPLEKVVDLPLDQLKVDFRETVKIPDVKPGQAIAVKRPAVPGVAGVSVTGKPLYPPKVKDPVLRGGKGVKLEEKDGLLFALATHPGLPRFTSSTGIIEVDPIFRQKESVGISTGNIRFSGSVEVNGNVEEGALVQCEGNQEIFGTVTGATLKAWGSIKIHGNVFQAEISAGQDASWVRKWDGLLRAVEEHLYEVLEVEQHNASINAMPSAAPEKTARGRPDDVLRISAPQSEAIFLAEKFRAMVIAFSQILKEDLSKVPKEMVEKITATKNFLLKKDEGLFQKAKAVGESVADLRVWIEKENQKALSDVVLPYVQSSKVEAVRDIIVSGQGVFYSTLIAGRSIRVDGAPGIVRGSEITAREVINVKAAGGQGPTPTVLRVSERGRIVAGTIYPNTILSLGRHKVRTENTLQSVEAKVVDGNVIIASRTGIVHVD